MVIVSGGVVVVVSVVGSAGELNPEQDEYTASVTAAASSPHNEVAQSLRLSVKLVAVQ